MGDTAEVKYKALADFSQLHRAALQAKKDIADLRKAQADANAKDLAEQKKLQTAYQQTSKQSNARAKAAKAAADADRDAATAAKSASSELGRLSKSNDTVTKSTKAHSTAERDRAKVLKSAATGFSRLKSAEAALTAENRRSETSINRASTAWNAYRSTLRSSTLDVKKTATAVKNKVVFVEQSAAADRDAGRAARDAAKDIDASARAHDRHRTATDSDTKSTSGFTAFLRLLGGVFSRTTQETEGLNKKFVNQEPLITRARSSWLSYRNTLRAAQADMSRTGKSADTLGSKIHHALSQKSSVGGLPWGILIGLIGALLSVINPAIAGLGALGTAALALAGNIGSLVGNLTLLGPGIAAIVSVAAGVKVALGGVSQAFQDAGTDADAYAKDLKNLSPSARSFVKQLVGMKDAWKDVQKTVQESFFSKFVDDLGTLKTLLPIVSRYLQVGASNAGTFVDKFLKMASSGPWTDDFGRIISSNDVILGHLGDGLLSILDIFRNLTAAAAPFAEMLTGKLAAGLKNLQKATQSSRDSGSLAAWIDQTNTRLLIWWQIIKNIGSTLFNYGKATSQLGDWLTQGFLNITEGWKKASAAATKAGSPFQKYLQNIKPVLTEVKGLLGDFFSWLGREGEDPSNLKTMTSLLHTIRTDLGPALGKVLDAFAKSGIGESIIKSLSSIADSIADILKQGGSDGLKSFFGTLETFFKAIDDLVSIPGVGQILGGIVAALGTLAAIKFVGKFTGITSLIKLLVGTKGLSTAATDASSLAKSFALLDGLKFAGVFGIIAAIDEMLIQYSATMAADASFPKGSGGSKAQQNASKQRQKSTIDENGANNSSPGGSVIDPGTGGGSLLDKKTQKEIDKDMGTFWGWVGKQFTPKKSLGATVGKVISDWWTSLFGPDSKSKGGLTGIGSQGIGGGPGSSVAQKKVDLGGSIKFPSVSEILATLGKILTGQIHFPSIPDILGSFTKILPKGFKFPDFLAPFKSILPKDFKFPDFLAPFKNLLPKDFKFPDFLAPFKNLLPGGFKWPDFGSLFKNLLPGGFKWPDFGGFFKNLLPGGFSWPDFGGFFRRLLPGGFQWPDFLGNFASHISGVLHWPSIGQILGAIGNFFGFPGYTGGDVSDLVSKAKNRKKSTPAPSGSVTSAVPAGGGGLKNRAFWNGGEAIYRAYGGGAHVRQIGTDTVPAVLTRGEYVLNKNIVGQIGVGSLNKLNKGTLSYPDLLASQAGKTSVAQQQKSKLLSPGFPTNMPQAIAAPTIPQAKVPSSSGSHGNLTTGDIIINNPVPERASDSLPRSIRKVAYATNRRH